VDGLDEGGLDEDGGLDDLELSLAGSGLEDLGSEGSLLVGAAEASLSEINFSTSLLLTSSPSSAKIAIAFPTGTAFDPSAI
jgi:hypothetical protein